MRYGVGDVVKLLDNSRSLSDIGLGAFAGLNVIIKRVDILDIYIPYVFERNGRTFNFGDNHVEKLIKKAECVLEQNPNMNDVLERPLCGSATETKPTNPKDAAATSRLDISLYPQSAICYGSLGMTEGDYKYGGYNFREAGVNVSVYISALFRHALKYYNGEWADKKTKVPHLASMNACTAILIDGHVQGNITDDRPPAVDMAELLDEMQEIVTHLQTIFPLENKPARCTEVKKDE